MTVNRETVGRINNLKSNNQVALAEYASLNKDLRLHKIEWHRKISLSLACVVLFLIGAPLGSIIRKGGVGTPLVFAIIFFMVFYFSSTTGEKLAKEATFSPFSVCGFPLLYWYLLAYFLFTKRSAIQPVQQRILLSHTKESQKTEAKERNN
jgi:lipopolysaccharide export system permease protein